MKNNYNSFGGGLFAWFKNGSGSTVGSSTDSRSMITSTSWLFAILMLLTFSVSQQVNATTCPNATVIAPSSLPITNATIICGTTNDITATSVAASVLTGGCSNTNYYGGLESLYSFTPTATGMYSLSMSGQTWTQISVFNGCPTTAGTICIAGIADTLSSKSLTMNLTAGVTYFILFDTFPSPASPCPGTFSLSQLLPNTATAIVNGGLWSNAATWGGTLPNAASTVVIPAGAIVTVDQVTSVASLSVTGTLQWNGTANAMTIAGDLTVNSAGKLLPYSTSGGGVTINIAGNFQNNGYANFAFGTINFNGSGSTLSGNGVFEGDGTRGIIRTLAFQNLGSNTVSTSQNLTVTAGLTHTGGSLNTNGKIRIDNTAQIYGQALNLQVASIAVTNMGSLYTVAPVVFGAAVTQWSNITGVLNTLYVSGNNVYRCTTAANIGATAPTHTSGISQNLLWIGTTGTLGNSFLGAQAHVLGTQYFYGNNLYTCTVAGTASSTAPPVHTSGAVVSGTATFLYVGTVAKVSVNFDSVTGTVRSLNLTQPGSGYVSAPSTAFSVGVLAGTGSGAAASAVYFQQIAGPLNSLTQKSGGATITGGLAINSDQGASVASTNVQASSGVGNISTTNGGVNYTVAPTVGFAGPPTLNLVTNSGSGYTAAPTVVLTGGTLVSGTALAATNFIVTVNQGKVVSVYLNTGTSATYSVPPTLSLSTGNATIAFPAGCWPTATANIGSNRQITSFTITNSGFGYAAAPIVGIGSTTTNSGTALGGTFTTAATAPTARIALYNLTLNLFTPSTVAVVATDDATIPANRKMNNLSLSGNGIGLNLTNNLVLFGTSPMFLTTSVNAPGNVLNLGGNNLLFTWNGYAGTTTTYGANKAYITNGSMTLTGRGGGTTGSTFNFPFSGAVTVFTGGGSSTAVTGGTDALTVKVTEVGAPTNTVTGGTGIALGNRAFKVETATTLGAATASPTLFGGTAPTVRLNYNEQDGLTTTQPQTIVLESTALNGAWNTRSAAIGASGPLAATGGLTTGTVAPTLALFNSGNFYAWGTGAPTISGIDNTTLCANSGAFSLSGTNFLGVTAVKIGGTDVLTFTVVNDTTITGFAGSGTTGNISVTKNGVTVTGIQNITVSPSPIAPTVSTSAVSINLGGTVTVTASGGSGTFRWYNDANAGTLLFTGATFSAPVCSGNLWVAEFNGSCEGLRRMVTITVAPTAIVSSATSFCGVGSPVTLTASPADATITYSWSSLTAPATVAPATGASSITSSLSQTSDFRLTATKGTCTAVSNISIGVYPLPSATVTSTAQGVCPGTGATIGSGLVAGNFAVTSIPYVPFVAPSNAVVVSTNGVPNVPLTGGSLDDGGWSGFPIGFNFNFFGNSFNTISAGTNGLLMFGTPPGYGTANGQLGQFTFNATGGVFPNAANPGNVIALMAADQYFGNGTSGSSSSTLTYWTQGYAPNRIFVIEYSKVDPCCSDNVLGFTAQARLYETLGTVDIAIVSKTSTNSPTVGLQDATKTIGAVAPGRQAFSGTVTTPETWRFIPPSNYNTTWFANGVAMPSVTANPTATPPVVGYANPGVNVLSIPVSPVATTTYSISYTNQITGCTNAAGSAEVAMAVLGTTVPAGLTTIASATTVCSGQSVTFSTSYTITAGMTYQWQNSTDGGTTWTDIASATAATYTAIPTASSYRCKLISCNGVPGFTNSVTISYANSVVSTTPGLRCGYGTATVGAIGSTGTTVKWYANATGGAALGSGTSFVTPIISANTTYYAGAETYVSGALPIGAGGTNSSTAGQSLLPGFWGGTKTQYIIRASELLSAGIGAGNITSLGFEPTSSGQTYQGFSVSLAPVTADVMTTTFISTGLSQVYAGTLPDNGFTPVANTLNNLAFGTGTGSASTFNWDGSSNILVSISWTSVPAAFTAVATTMKVDNVGFVSTAYDQADSLDPATMLASTTADATTSFRPRFTINGQVVCSSPRVPVVVTVTPPPALVLSGTTATICAESNSAPITVTTGASSYTNYVWTTPTTVTGNSTAGWVFNPLNTTTYNLVASQTTGATPCATTASVTVSVNPTPTVLSIDPVSASACADIVLPLATSGGTIGATGQMQIGTGTLGNTLSTPYKVFWGGSKTQALYTAAELTSLGLIAGSSISSIGHVALSGVPLLMNNYSVSVGFVSSTTLGTGFIAAPTTTILNNVAYTAPTGTGNIDYTLTTPIVWDGVSSLLVETCFNNNNGGGASTNSLSVASTTVATGLNLYRTNDNTIDLCSNSTTPSGTTTRPNLRIFVLGQVATTWSPITNLYTDAAGTIPYTTGTNAATVYFKTNAAAAAVTYTATATTSLGCARSTTVPVTVYQTAAPTGLQFYQFCPTGGATVSSMTPTLTGANIKWYATSTGGTALAPTTALTQGYFWASQTLNGCESPTRFLVFAISNATAAPSSSPTQQFCNSATVANLTANGTGVQWYTTATGGTALASTAVLATGTYYVSQTSGGCESSRSAVSVTVTAVPAPTGAATQSLSSLLTLGDIVVTGSNITWYATAANAASGTNPLSSTQLLANTTYYATQTINGCRSAASLAVTITTLANQDFDMTQFTYYPNPVIDLLNISYSQDMTSVKVFNIVGQQLMSKQINSNTTQIDMSSYANGAYFIQVTTENAMKTVRVIKK
jgi:hypothetical protein